MTVTNKLSEKQERDLIEQLIGGSQAAFRELYICYRDPLLHYCKRYLNDEAGAEDVVQDIFMQLWETHDTLNIISSFSGYLYTAAQNRMLNMFRHFDIHARYAKNVLMKGNDSTVETEDSILCDDYAKLLNELIDALTPMQKEVFRLSRIEGLSYREISERLQISVPAVQKHASLALKKIKKNLEQHAGIYFQSVMILFAFFL